MSDLYTFGDFVLDARNRTLRRGDEAVPLTPRYFDALELLVRERGTLVEKDRLFSEVWSDVIVSDAALTQCIKEIRSALGDDPSRPKYIKTVPKYGYMFVADTSTPAEKVPVLKGPARSLAAIRYASFGIFGGAVAGAFGGLIYGAALAFAPTSPGAVSVFVVLLAVNIMVGAVGALGVCTGIAAVRAFGAPRMPWLILGGGVGGFIIGGLAKLFGVDAFQFFLGQSPLGTAGAPEGGALGAAVGLAVALWGRWRSTWSPVLVAALISLAAGLLIGLAGGTLMGGSLHVLGRSFEASQLDLGSLARAFGEVEFGPATRIALTISDATLFGVFVASALAAAERWEARLERGERPASTSRPV